MERLIEGEVRKRLDKYVNNSETFDIHNGNEFTLNNVTLKQEFAKTLFRSVPALAHLLEPFELRYGFAGKLRFKVPWATLRGDAARRRYDGESEQPSDAAAAKIQVRLLAALAAC